MPSPYLFKNIKGFLISPPKKDSGHVVHQVEYVDDKQQAVSAFFKENKNGNPEASHKEVAFSELARLFMQPHSTPEYHLVKNAQNQTVGVISHHINLSIVQKVNIHAEQFKKIDYSDKTKKYQYKNVTVTKPDDIPCQFLNTLPADFFAHLMAEKEKGTLSVDMESLASALAGKYTLEEDDLHKGNFGIYTLVKDNKPHIVFFNIDHDLMLSDSIMSFLDMRISNWSYGEKAFNITANDLLNFPDLQDSANHYWPTYKRLIVPDDTKTFSSQAERTAFADLKNDPEFNRYKWKRFLKCILIPEPLMRKALAIHLDEHNAKDVAEISLITQALNERTMKLRAVLLSIPEFRFYLNSTHGQNDIKAIQQEFSDYMAESLPKQNDIATSLLNQINKKSAQYVSVCSNNSSYPIEAGDKPLHVCIKLGEFRFDESKKAFYSDLNTPNPVNRKLPIDIAAEMAMTYKIGSEKINPGQDPFCIIRHLLSEGARMTPKVNTVLKAKGINIENYQFQSQYYERDIKNYTELKTLIAEISKDPNLSLKTKKIIAVNVIQQQIKLLDAQELKQFKNDLNGTANTPIAPEFLFISQLRSSLWIVRAIRGLYGNSSTKSEINTLINQAQPQAAENTYRFFSTKTSPQPPTQPLLSEEESSRITLNNF